jgi:hypothetical protein
MVVLLKIPSCFVVSHPENTVHTGCIRCWSLKARCNKRRCLSTCAIGGSLHESRRSQNLASTPSPDFHTNLIKSKRDQVWWHLAVAATRTNPETCRLTWELLHLQLDLLDVCRVTEVSWLLFSKSWNEHHCAITSIRALQVETYCENTTGALELLLITRADSRCNVLAAGETTLL